MAIAGNFWDDWQRKRDTQRLLDGLSSFHEPDVRCHQRTREALPFVIRDRKRYYCQPLDLVGSTSGY